jgi:CheY-like chemotaxis protein
VNGVKDLLERSVGPDFELRFQTPGNLPMVMIDQNQTELALLNLVVNARDAMPDGGAITIALDEVVVEQLDDLAAGRYVRLSVEDSGVGMDEETLQRAIEPFFSTKQLGKGTGLGLSMVHGLAVQLNGVLRLSSTPGKGTKAEIYLPATSLPLEDGLAAQADAPEDARHVGKAKILLVDDDILIAMSTVDMLEDLGHEVIEANSGVAALEVLKRAGDVDLMITDFAMPGMNGAQLAAAVREIAPTLPVLLATGYAETPDGAELDLPRLGKPYTQAQLAREIGRLLASSEA